jgi:hypothetical protein
MSTDSFVQFVDSSFSQCLIQEPTQGLSAYRCHHGDERCRPHLLPEALGSDSRVETLVTRQRSLDSDN